jgi:FHA domain-containing protein
MTLVLRGLALNDDSLSNPLVGRFDDRGGEIGRSDNATFTLPDPERLISRVHARISHSEGTYWIENVSSAGPIVHNGRPLSSGMRVSLSDGDELRIGGYRLAVAFEHDETSATILRGRTTGQAPVRAGPIVPQRPAVAPLAVAPPSARAAGLPSVAAPAAKEGPAPASAAAPVQRAEALPSVAAPAAKEGAAPAQRPAAGSPAPAVAASPAARGGKAAPRPRTAEPAAGSEALWKGFEEGVGLNLPLPNGPSPELFSAIGVMLRIAVNGIHRLVSMRTVAKTEMHADLTMIQVRGNNPLKFSPEPAVALKMLLQPPLQGFLSGPSALRDAVIDLQSHQVGVMAGMRAALSAVLDRFDPTQLESRLTSRSVIETLIPSQRRARLWEAYLEHYRSLSEEAQEDFSQFFGEAFREAYSAQVQSLEAAGDDPAASIPSYPAGPKV